jgi:pimeloyl-ACP methyl ester carboxylesterase
VDEPAPVRTFAADCGGVRIEAEVRGAGPPVVLVHGFASDRGLNWGVTRWRSSAWPTTWPV